MIQQPTQCMRVLYGVSKSERSREFCQILTIVYGRHLVSVCALQGVINSFDIAVINPV
jgi:hypothetical protein